MDIKMEDKLFGFKSIRKNRVSIYSMGIYWLIEIEEKIAVQYQVRKLGLIQNQHAIKDSWKLEINVI